MSVIETIPTLDLNRYLGRWHEICRLPLRWEDEAATDITATYSLNEDGKVRVDNRCFDKDGKPTQALGEATPVDGTNTRLKVTFLPKGLRWLPFTDGDYWVLKLDPGYRVSLVATPNRKHLGLLSRDISLPPEIRGAYLAEAQRQGFDLADLITPQRTGRVVTDEMLANE